VKLVCLSRFARLLQPDANDRIAFPYADFAFAAAGICGDRYKARFNVRNGDTRRLAYMELDISTELGCHRIVSASDAASGEKNTRYQDRAKYLSSEGHGGLLTVAK
jgi:hypothetical protein